MACVPCPSGPSQLPLKRCGRSFYGLEVSLSSEGFVAPKANSHVDRGLTPLPSSSQGL